MTFSIRRLALASAFVLAGAASANATVVTFDDIATGGVYAVVPNGYGGLNWGNVYAIDQNFLPGSGYQYGAVSAPNAAFDASAQGGLFAAASGVFTFTSAEVTGAWADQTVTFDGYANGNLVDTATVSVLNTAPTLETFNWSGIDTVTFKGSNSQIVLDNVTINGNVPEPASWAIMALGLGGLGGALRMRRKAVAA